MNVSLGIAVTVMVAMVTGPPEWTLLHAGGSAEGHQELHRAAELVAAVREVAVVAGGDEEHTHGVQGEAQREVLPAGAGKEEPERDQMHDQERGRSFPVDRL